jgi:glucarate dehydratase
LATSAPPPLLFRWKRRCAQQRLPLGTIRPTIVEVETDNGLIGLGEMGGGGESAEAVFRAMKIYLVGHDPARLEEMRFLIANPTASLYNNRTQVLAALEFACLDILGQAWGVPVSDILGGRLRDRVPFASYCFFRYANPRTGAGEVRTLEQLVEHTCELKRRFGFTTHKLKGGVFHPDYELESYRALADARFRTIPCDSIRTLSGPPSKRSGSARTSRICVTIIWKIQCSGCTECGARAKRCEFR